MYMRLAHAGINPETILELQTVYETIIIPRLEQATGCLYTGLIVLEPDHDEVISMTLWDLLEHLEAYERTGAYKKNLKVARPYLTDASEEKMQLSADMKLEYVPAQEDPTTVKSYETVAQLDTEIPAKSYLENLRLLTVKIQPGKMEEFRRIYTEEIIPVLRTVKGCRNALLTAGLEERNEVMSITFWNSKQDIDEYERSGLFEWLNNKLKYTYTGLYRWKMAVDEQQDKHAVTSDDQTIQYYSVLIGRSLK